MINTGPVIFNGLLEWEIDDLIKCTRERKSISTAPNHDYFDRIIAALELLRISGPATAP